MNVDQADTESSHLVEALCANCQAIDFDTMSDMQGLRARCRSGVGVYLHDLSYDADQMCPLCSVFSDLKQRHTDLPKKISWRLTGRPASLKFFDDLPEDSDSIILTVDPSGSNHVEISTYLLFAKDTGALSARQLPETIDWMIIKEWLRFCQTHHSKLCPKSIRLDILGFKLIDCEHRTIVDARELMVDYITLSYVWGHNVFDHKAGPELATTLPRTIDDAIEAVKYLGFRYLWIDRYCIDQTQSAHKTALIRKMGEIYSNSAVTIIAAAGDNPNYGLPGVARTPRAPQPRVQVGLHVLVRQSSRDIDQIRNSKWNTRGWTFQEGLLAKRKLIFTDSHVSFQCNGMYCVENLTIPLRELHTKGLHEFRSNVRLPRPFPLHGVGKEPWNIFARISEFCARDITFERDIPGAFEGIYQRFASLKDPVAHYHGVPLFGAHLCPEGKYDFRARFIHGLLWTIRCSHEARRRNAFPSWSWMGWQLSPKAWFVHRGALYGRGSAGTLRYAADLIAIGLQNGKQCSLSTIQDAIGKSSTVEILPDYLHIDGFVFELELSKSEVQDTYLDPRGRDWSEWELYVPGLRPAQLTVFCLALTSSTRSVDLMVMSRNQDESYERIGLQEINFTPWESSQQTVDPLLHLVDSLGVAMVRKQVKLR